MSFLDIIEKRRSIYALGNQLTQSFDEVEETIHRAIKAAPSAFNSQSSRAVILKGAMHHKLWDITKDSLKPLLSEVAFTETEKKLDSFRAGYGTILFFEDHSVIEELQRNFPLYADNFPRWSEQSTGIAQFAVWSALSELNIGASLQHYNPLIDEKVAEEWDIPENWHLTAQMPFGSIEAKASEKSYMDDQKRFKTFK